MQLVMQRIAALYLAIALEGFDAAASLCQTCQGGSVGQPCLGQESRSYNFFGIFFGSNCFRPGPFLEFQSHNLFSHHSFVFFCFHGSHLSVMGKCVLDQSVFSVFGQNGAIWIMCPLWAVC